MRAMDRNSASNALWQTRIVCPPVKRDRGVSPTIWTRWNSLHQGSPLLPRKSTSTNTFTSRSRHLRFILLPYALLHQQQHLRQEHSLQSQPLSTCRNPASSPQHKMQLTRLARSRHTVRSTLRTESGMSKSARRREPQFPRDPISRIPSTRGQG